MITATLGGYMIIVMTGTRRTKIIRNSCE